MHGCFPLLRFFTLWFEASWFTECLFFYLLNPFSHLVPEFISISLSFLSPFSQNHSLKVPFFLNLQFPRPDHEVLSWLFLFIPYNSYIYNEEPVLSSKLSIGITQQFTQSFLSNFFIEKKSIWEHITHSCMW